MRRMRMFFLLMGGFWGALLALGCASEPRQLGDPVPAGAERATLQAILQDKARYAGKEVVVEGRVGGIGCADCGGVLVTDRTWRLLVEPADPQRFRIEPRAGVPVRVWGVVEVEGAEGEGEGGEHEKEAAEKKGPAHEKLHEDLGNVELKARGVEWL